MATRTPCHQRSSGLYVSGLPEQHKERPTMASRAIPYTGGDLRKSGDLGKMFDISTTIDPSSNSHSSSSKPSHRPSLSSQHNSGSFKSIHNSGSFSKSSGSLQLQPTGLITSGPVGSSSGGGGNRRSGQLERSLSMRKTVYGAAVTSVGQEVKFGLNVSKTLMWVFVVMMLMALVVGVFMLVTVKNAVILIVVVGILVPVVVVMVWNCAWGMRGLLGFLSRYPDSDLRAAADGQFVKVTGIVTCGSIPLEASYQRIPRCVYVSTELYAKGCGGKLATSKCLPFSWGLRFFEKHVADFYISDYKSGARALVKAGYGAKVAPFVKPATMVDTSKENRELSPRFLLWLANRKLSSDDCTMRLEEGYIREGSNVSVMGIVQRHDNMVMIIPSVPPASTGCQWIRCLLPTYIEGLILICDDSQDSDVILV